MNVFLGGRNSKLLSPVRLMDSRCVFFLSLEIVIQTTRDDA